MIPAIVVFLYLAVVVYIGIFAFRRAKGKEEAEDYFLASRSLGPFVFLFSLFGTNMTAFAILGSSGHAFTNGIVTFGLMASSSGLVIPLTIFLIGTRVWALGKKYGFMTPVQMFRDRWECGARLDGFDRLLNFCRIRACVGYANRHSKFLLQILQVLGRANHYLHRSRTIARRLSKALFASRM